jgi:hypothetical protein
MELRSNRPNSNGQSSSASTADINTIREGNSLPDQSMQGINPAVGWNPHLFMAAYQNKAPHLNSLELFQIKEFIKRYKMYRAKTPRELQAFILKPGQLISEDILSILTYHSPADLDQLLELDLEQMVTFLLQPYQAQTTLVWKTMVSRIKMASKLPSNTASKNLIILLGEYFEDFNFAAQAAGTPYQPDVNTIINMFVNNLSPDMLRREVGARKHDSLEEAYMFARDFISRAEVFLSVENNLKSFSNPYYSNKDLNNSYSNSNDLKSKDRTKMIQPSLEGCRYCKEPGHALGNCPKLAKQIQRWKFKSNLSKDC